MEQETIQVSIIVPVYNVRDYIVRCVNSLIKQKAPSDFLYEIVVVNDGTPDDSIDVLEQFLRQEKTNSQDPYSVRIVHRENGGLSAARNTGLDAAAGQYVWFVDSDDALDSEAVFDLYRMASVNDLDVLMFNMKNISDKPEGKLHSSIISNSRKVSGTVMSGMQLFCRMREEKCYHAEVCCCMFRREWMQKNELRFCEGIVHEDELFTPIMLASAERAMYYPGQPYLRYIREGSITSSDNVGKRMCSLAAVITKLFAFRDKIPEEALWAYNDNLLGLVSIFYGEVSKIRKPEQPVKLAKKEVTKNCRVNHLYLPFKTKLYCVKNQIGAILK